MFNGVVRSEPDESIEHGLVDYLSILFEYSLCTNSLCYCVFFAYTMASGGRGDDDDDWEDASDIFEVRSEAGSTDTLTPDEQGVDTSKSSQLTVIDPPEDDRREQTPPRVMGQRRGRESDRDRPRESRDPGS